MRFIDQILGLNEEFICDTPFHKVVEKVSSKASHDSWMEKFTPGFSIEWLSATRFKFLSNISLGTMHKARGDILGLGGIHGEASLFDLENGKTKVVLSIGIRFEVLLFVFISFVMGVMPMVFQNEFEWWKGLSLLFVPVIPWFLFRLQERSLLNKVKRFLNEDCLGTN